MPYPHMTDEQLFQWMDHTIEEKMLFKQSDLKRSTMLKMLGIGKDRFGRIVRTFHPEANFTAYINEKRVHYAAKQIAQNPRVPIKTWVFECGMSNPITFCRLFRKYFGMTPTQYRYQQKQQKV